MSNNQIIGREYEQKLIKNCMESGKSELIAIYGRRRVGKTFLIKKFFNEKFDFSFTGIYNTSRAVQLSRFQKNLEQHWNRPLKRIKDWFEAFDQLKEYLDTLAKEKIIVFLDEIPWMETRRSNFLSAFTLFWNEWGASKENLKLFVCGSATTWMLSNIIGDKGGLYGRVSRAIHLAPFNLKETETFLKDVKGVELNRYKILEVYMVMGGIPFYLDMLEKNIPLEASIDNLFFKQGGPLRTEFTFLFRSLFQESRIHKRVVEALAEKQKGMTRQELMGAIGYQEGGALTTVLENLQKCDFIRKYQEIGKLERDTRYQLSDLFSLFHLKFVENHDGQDESFWSKVQGKGMANAWVGYAFEQVCFHHVSQIKHALSIGGVLSNVYSWGRKGYVDEEGNKHKGGQIDMLIDRADDVINICEMKYVNSPFEITSEYEIRLRERAALFASSTRTQKALQHTFITTYGVKQNIHSSIVQSEVTMDRLFE